MAYFLNGSGFHIDLCETYFNCPKCTCPHTEADWCQKLDASRNGYIYISCKGCKTRLGITVDMMGDLQVWLKEDEYKDRDTN